MFRVECCQLCRRLNYSSTAVSYAVQQIAQVHRLYRCEMFTGQYRVWIMLHLTCSRAAAEVREYRRTAAPTAAVTVVRKYAVFEENSCWCSTWKHYGCTAVQQQLQPALFVDSVCCACVRHPRFRFILSCFQDTTTGRRRTTQQQSCCISPHDVFTYRVYTYLVYMVSSYVLRSTTIRR